MRGSTRRSRDPPGSGTDVAQKRSRQTFEKLKREQAIKERRARKQERKQAARLAKASAATEHVQSEGENNAGHDDGWGTGAS
jgi:hypothetical protein